MNAHLRVCYYCGREMSAEERFAVPGITPTVFAHYQHCTIRMAAAMLHNYHREGPQSSPPEAQHIGLTETEMAVLACLADGLTNKKIAQQLNISDKRARNLVSSVMGKLDAENRTQAVSIATRRGLLGQRPE